MTENNEEVVVDAKTNEGDEGAEVETISVSKKDYDKMNETVGSLKRELKDLRKPKEETSETSKTNKPDENALVQKLERMALRQAGVTHPDDVELAQKTAKKWGVDIDEVLGDEDFKVKLERQQTDRSNVEATSKVKGGAGNSQAKNTPEYWIAKGTPPSATDVPDGATRRKIAAAFLKSVNAGNGKKFYNE